MTNKRNCVLTVHLAPTLEFSEVIFFGFAVFESSPPEKGRFGEGDRNNINIPLKENKYEKNNFDFRVSFKF